eukprot:TRINITY_DN80605_c0_g1_i1.p1 TRINITY_DN80605_c0_g1~~TRINITY_DN80605_c0_g1_i1.p1  ORF type:complete len:232 (-),score=55.98 TRINITY_DN80605_c0_g1_i1:80-775(-)
MPGTPSRSFLAAVAAPQQMCVLRFQQKWRCSRRRWCFALLCVVAVWRCEVHTAMPFFFASPLRQGCSDASRGASRFLLAAAAAAVPLGARAEVGESFAAADTGKTLIEVFFALVTLAAILKPEALLTAGTKVFKGSYCHVSHILVDDEELARELFSQVEGKPMETFAQVARKHSVCASAKMSGDLGEVQPGGMPEGFERVCFDPQQPVGVPLGPVKSDFGYHILWIMERTS